MIYYRQHGYQRKVLNVIKGYRMDMIPVTQTNALPLKSFLEYPFLSTLFNKSLSIKHKKVMPTLSKVYTV